MKYTLLTITMLLVSLVCRGQDEKEMERRDNLVKECNCPNQIINTDSVYSFFRTFPFKPQKRGYGFSIIEQTPIPFDTIFTEAPKRYFFDNLRGYYDDHVPFRKEEKIPPAILRKMLAKMFDPTTQYTPAIEKWNTAMMGEEWITYNSYKYMGKLFKERVKDNNKFLKIIKDVDVASSRPIAMSIPVFDDDYNYAFLVLKKSSYYHSFALFKREANGWAPILVLTPGEKFKNSQLKRDFSDF